MVKIQMGQNQMQADMAAHVAARDQAVSKLWEARGQDHDKIVQMGQWIHDHELH